MNRHFPLIEDRPARIVPSFRFRVRRFLVATDLPFALFLAAVIITAAACFLGAVFAVIP